jgi:hypothetical protein
VAEFDGEGIVSEALEQSRKMDEGFERAMKGKRELEEHCAKFACLTENVETLADVAFVFRGGRGLVSEALPKLCGEEQGAICCHASDPAGGVIRADGLIKGGVDSDSVEKLGEESCFVKVF